MSTNPTPDLQHIRIWVGVDDSGEGYILAWDGCRELQGAEDPRFCTHDWFSESIASFGRETTYWRGMDHPEAAGVYQFTGRMYWKERPTIFEPDDGCEAFDGSWTTIYTLPDLTQESDE